MEFVLSSPAFGNGEEIPSRYTGDRANLSPPLEWSGAPPQTQSFVLIMEDLGAASHPAGRWGLYDTMPARAMRPEAVGHGVKTELIGHCINDVGHSHYDGPAPPGGDGPHRYVFIIAQTSLVGAYTAARRSCACSSLP